MEVVLTGHQVKDVMWHRNENKTHMYSCELSDSLGHGEEQCGGRGLVSFFALSLSHPYINAP